MAKRVKMMISEDNIHVGFDTSKYNDDLIVSVNKPNGVTMSATEVNNLLADAYEHVLGTSSFSVTKVESTISDLLSQDTRVSEVIKYKVD